MSRKLVSPLADIFPDASHVQFHGLADKTDTSCELLLRNITNLHGYIQKKRPLYFMTDKGFRVL
ncbi:MAG: hypothetical protein F6K17_16995 [Okeania sp. SIO3C4]|nr:hypothetical protein [Okeania sp. SIO3C4]